MYLDSELSPDRTTAVRGHLRTCEACSKLFEEERELIDAAMQLPDLDPPDSIWEGVQARIAREEVKDSLEWPAWRWLRLRWRPVAGLGVAAAMAATIFVAQSRGPKDSQPEKGAELSVQSTQFAAAVEKSYSQEREEELAEADRQYIQTIAELREMLEEDRARWDSEEAAAIDERLAAFRQEAIGTRLAIESGSLAVQSRDMLYAGYRNEIGFLQSALAGELPGGER